MPNQIPVVPQQLPGYLTERSKWIKVTTSSSSSGTLSAVNTNTLTGSETSASRPRDLWGTQNTPQSELRIGGETAFSSFGAPPNALRRFVWKWLLGATWVDLRPENNLKELGKLR